MYLQANIEVPSLNQFCNGNANMQFGDALLGYLSLLTTQKY
jgi:hypothetical protein